ncbi:MAG: methylmalonyl Co-A mutase-associated GTPase MeaB, partial [Flavobacteriales bacterium]
DKEYASELIESCFPNSGDSLRIGVTGVPGVGKSAFLEKFGSLLTGKGYKVAVLTVDPSSERSKGSILGDKTRMQELSMNENAFIRPSPSSGSLGGVARKTRETMILCEAAGFDVVLIETIGVGQSETAVRNMVDYFMLLMLAGAGDELQGIKRGIMEMADGMVITKADGENYNKALQAKKEYSQALHLLAPKESGNEIKIEICSALNNEGIEEVWNVVNEHFECIKKNGYFEQQRREQAKYWFRNDLQNMVLETLMNKKMIKELIPELEKSVEQGKMSTNEAVEQIFDELNIK